MDKYDLQVAKVNYKPPWNKEESLQRVAMCSLTIRERAFLVEDQKYKVIPDKGTIIEV